MPIGCFLGPPGVELDESCTLAPAQAQQARHRLYACYGHGWLERESCCRHYAVISATTPAHQRTRWQVACAEAALELKMQTCTEKWRRELSSTCACHSKHVASACAAMRRQACRDRRMIECLLSDPGVSAAIEAENEHEDEDSPAVMQEQQRQHLSPRHTCAVTLPKDGLLCVLGMVAPMELGRCSQVCREWNEAASEENLWAVACQDLSGIPDTKERWHHGFYKQVYKNCMRHSHRQELLSEQTLRGGMWSLVQPTAHVTLWVACRRGDPHDVLWSAISEEDVNEECLLEGGEWCEPFCVQARWIEHSEQPSMPMDQVVTDQPAVAPGVKDFMQRTGIHSTEGVNSAYHPFQELMACVDVRDPPEWLWGCLLDDFCLHVSAAPPSNP